MSNSSQKTILSNLKPRLLQLSIDGFQGSNLNSKNEISKRLGTIDGVLLCLSSNSSFQLTTRNFNSLLTFLNSQI